MEKTNRKKNKAKRKKKKTNSSTSSDDYSVGVDNATSKHLIKGHVLTRELDEPIWSKYDDKAATTNIRNPPKKIKEAF